MLWCSYTIVEEIENPRYSAARKCQHTLLCADIDLLSTLQHTRQTRLRPKKIHTQFRGHLQFSNSELEKQTHFLDFVEPGVLE